ncbi:MAG: DUF4338 domain-containing protein [Planctomycetota bacterium]
MILKYRGRTITAEDVDFIRGLIAKHPGLSRRRLSAELCRAWNWVQANGVLRDMVARGLMLALERAGHITLPPRRQFSLNPLAHRRPPEKAPLLCWEPIEVPLQALRPLEWRQVRRGPDEGLFATFIETHHYLGYTQPVGEHLKYLIFARGTPVACLGWSSAPRHIGCRDRFIGWRAEVRRQNLHLLAYNTRFLILPWVKVPHLASHLLGAMARRLSRDWELLYNHPVYLLETFVDPERHRGTCYRAAGWICVGRTTGRGKNDQTNKPNRSLKDIWVYALARDFREKLCRIDACLSGR